MVRCTALQHTLVCEGRSTTADGKRRKGLLYKLFINEKWLLYFCPTILEEKFNFYLGTGTLLSIDAITASISKPSNNASGFRINRCRNKGGATAFTSSGVTKSLPAKYAAV